MKPLRALLLLLCLLPIAAAAQQPGYPDVNTQVGDDQAAITPDPACDTDALTQIPDKQPLDFTKETRLVIDQPGILDNECALHLKHAITQLEQDTGAQLRILIVNTLGDSSIEEFSNDTFHTWKLGQKGKDDGLLIVIAQKERRVRIEVGYGLEEHLTDADTGDILRSELDPSLRAGTYGKGLSLAVNDIAQRIRQVGGTAPKHDEEVETDYRALFYFLFLQLAGIIVIAVTTRLQWRLPQRLLASLAVVELLALIGLPFHFTQSKGELVGLVFVTPLFGLIGLPFGKNPAGAFRALGRMAIIFSALGAVIVFFAIREPAFRPSAGPLFFADGMVSFFFGLVWTVMRGARRTGSTGYWSSRSYTTAGGTTTSDDDSSSSSSDWSSSDSSSSSDDSFSDSGGGGGDSGGGGASDSF